jgi:hypothetical protein
MCVRVLECLLNVEMQGEELILTIKYAGLERISNHHCFGENNLKAKYQ